MKKMIVVNILIYLWLGLSACGLYWDRAADRRMRTEMFKQGAALNVQISREITNDIKEINAILSESE